MATNNPLDQVVVNRPVPKKRDKSNPSQKKSCVANRMTSANTNTRVFSLRVTESELQEMNRIAELLKEHIRSGNRNNLLRACFQAMKKKNINSIINQITKLP
ncbi:hypothetical protein CI610_03243 [invertebrate metagenome]|uniref:Uncharacterized protein n=1 Tax=invertebrate metagenome TaxID=1711999 RepID=A0A2H9T3R0_9ZZZZ